MQQGTLSHPFGSEILTSAIGFKRFQELTRLFRGFVFPLSEKAIYRVGTKSSGSCRNAAMMSVSSYWLKSALCTLTPPLQKNPFSRCVVSFVLHQEGQNDFSMHQGLLLALRLKPEHIKTSRWSATSSIGVLPDLVHRNG